MPVLVDATTGKAYNAVLPDFPTQQAFPGHRRTTAGRVAGAVAGRAATGVPDRRRSRTRARGQPPSSPSWYRVVDLTTGRQRLVELPPGTGTPLAMSWTADGRLAVDVYGTADEPGDEGEPSPTISWTIDPATGDAGTAPLTGVVAPGGGISATYPRTTDLVDAVQFETATGTDPAAAARRPLPRGRRACTPVGWVEEDVAGRLIDPPPSDVVERPRLALITSPDRPGVGVDFREFLPRLPPSLGLSIAVDLVPDLTGDPDQELTHDFTAEPGRRPGARPRSAGRGRAAGPARGIAFIRMMQKRA